MGFWATFAINEALLVVQAAIASISIRPSVKTAAENFILAGQALLVAIQSGS